MKATPINILKPNCTIVVDEEGDAFAVSNQTLKVFLHNKTHRSIKKVKGQKRKSKPAKPTKMKPAV